MSTSALGVLSPVRGSFCAVGFSSPLSPLRLVRCPGVSLGWLVYRGFSPLLFDCFFHWLVFLLFFLFVQTETPDCRRALVLPLSCSSCLVSCFCWCFVSLSFVFWRANVCLLLLVAGVAVCFVPVLWWVCVGGCLFFRSSAC